MWEITNVRNQRISTTDGIHMFIPFLVLSVPTNALELETFLFNLEAFSLQY
jgi:hypothetical protein